MEGGVGVALGEAFIDVHANTKPFQDELGDGIDKGAKRAEDDFEDTGREIGDALTTGIGGSLRDNGPQLAKDIQDGLRRQKIRTKVTVEVDRDNNVVRKWVSTITEDVEEAFREAGRPGGPFSKIGSAISDAIGAGFNVSGRSPLIALLIPVLLVIGSLIVAALQAANALVALLTIIPALLPAIALQVGVVAIAFQGMGEAIQGAFAAKNAKELKEAIDGLTPSAQAFVKSLLPLRDWWSTLSKSVQENFFAGLGQLFGKGGSLQPLLDSLSTRLGPLARDLGELLGSLAEFFGSANFRIFLSQIVPATQRWLDTLGPALLTLMTGITSLASSPAVLDLLERFGGAFAGVLATFGSFLTQISDDPEFAAWLSDMVDTLRSLGDLFMAVLDFVKVFLAQLNEAGGKEVIDKFTEAFNLLIAVLASPVGQKAMEGFIDMAKFGISAFFGLVMVLLALVALIEVIGETINGVFRAAWRWLTETAGPGIADFFRNLISDIADLFNPTRMLNMFYSAGRNIIQGLINGIRSMFSGIGSAMGAAMQVIRNYTPFSPAKEGPLSGSGDPMLAGENIMQRLAEGIHHAIPDVRAATSNAVQNIYFGTGAIQMGFQGSRPSEQEATATGMAVVGGIGSGLARRNISLAVRSL